MAKIHLDRLKKRYGYSGEKLSELSKKIIANNAENVSRNIARRTQEDWNKSVKKISGKLKVIIPDAMDVLPGHSTFTIKAAVKGKLISDTLRDSLTQKLRETLSAMQSKKKPLYSTTAGKRGKLKQEHVRAFEDSIRDVFSAYTKRDPKIGVPPNVHTIAVTEMRSSANMIKDEYAKSIQAKNPRIEMVKRWLHNSSLSKTPRKGHLEAHLQTVALDDYFQVPNYIDGKGKAQIYKGTTRMSRPHDPNAPAEQVIGCNCDVQFLARQKTV